MPDAHAPEPERYEDWTVAALRKRATELEIEGRSYMKKQRLIDAVRRHEEG